MSSCAAELAERPPAGGVEGCAQKPISRAAEVAEGGAARLFTSGRHATPADPHRHCARRQGGGVGGGEKKVSSCAAEVAERSLVRGLARRETRAVTRSDTARTSRAPACAV